MTLKPSVTRITLLLILLTLSACTDTGQTNRGSFIAKTSVPKTQPSIAANRPTVALVMKTLTNPFFVEMEKGAREAARTLDVQLIVKTASEETSVEQQIEILDGLIRDHVNAIVVAPAESIRLIPVLKKARDAGIVLINIDNPIDAQVSNQLGLEQVPFIGPNNENGAYLSARELVKQLDPGSHVAIMEGIPEASNSQARKQGAIRAFQEGSNLQLNIIVSAHWKIDEAYQAAQQIFEKDPQIQAIYCANDMMALGVVEYLQKSGRKNVLVAGYDALEQGRAAVQDGRIVATVDQQAAHQGYLGVQYAVRALNGETVPSFTDVDVILLTSKTK
jgi:ribose transport system substrate-binding protein